MHGCDPYPCSGCAYHSSCVLKASSVSIALSKSWFSGRGWGQQLVTFQSPAVHCIARTSSLNCLSCRNPYRTPHSLDCLPSFHWEALFLHWRVLRRIPFPKLGLNWVGPHFWDMLVVGKVATAWRSVPTSWQASSANGKIDACEQHHHCEKDTESFLITRACAGVAALLLSGKAISVTQAREIDIRHKQTQIVGACHLRSKLWKLLEGMHLLNALFSTNQHKSTSTPWAS